VKEYRVVLIRRCFTFKWRSHWPRRVDRPPLTAVDGVSENATEIYQC